MRRSTTAVYDGSRTVSTGVTPEGIPGCAGRPLRRTAPTTPRPPRRRSTSGQAAGNALDRAASASSSTRAPATSTSWQIIIDNLAAIGIEAVAEPLDTETYFTQLADGACVSSAGPVGSPTTRRTTTSCTTCSTPTSLGGNNHGLHRTRSSTRWSTRPRQTVDPDEQADAVPRRPRTILLNEDIGVDPDQLVPGRLRLQRGPDRQLPPDATSVSSSGRQVSVRAEPELTAASQGR